MVERPRQECWNEQVPVRSSDYTGAIVGGVAGGVIGNQIGGGNGKTVATAVGAATGAVVGDRMSNGSAVSYRTEQRCRTVIERHQVPVVQPVVRPVVQPVYVQPVPVHTERVYYIEEHHHKKHKHKHKHHGHGHGHDDD
jgi:uncharacterized protein YcfJ